jgi:uncharacterized protein with HEPN domain
MKSQLSYIFHILDEIRFIEEKIEQEALSRKQFLGDDTLKRAFTRSIEIIGEAVKKLPSEMYGQYPDIPWRQIAGMRDRLIHGYFSVDYELVWDVINTQIALLKKELEIIIAAEGE